MELPVESLLLYGVSKVWAISQGGVQLYFKCSFKAPNAVEHTSISNY
jgi:hypothetical protein